MRPRPGRLANHPPESLPELQRLIDRISPGESEAKATEPPQDKIVEQSGTATPTTSQDLSNAKPGNLSK